VGVLVGCLVGWEVGNCVGGLDGGGVCKFTVLLGAGVLVLTDTVGGGVGGFVVGKGVGEVVLSPGHGGHTDEFGEGEGGVVETSGTSGQLGPSHGSVGGGVIISGTSGQSSVPSHGEGGGDGASVRMEEQIVGDGDWVDVVSEPSFLLPRVGSGGQMHTVGLGVTSVPSPRLEDDGTHLSMLELGLLVLHAGIAAAEGLADELGAIEGELVPFMIPGTAVNGAFVGVGSKGEGVTLGGLKKSSLVGIGVSG